MTSAKWGLPPPNLGSRAKGLSSMVKLLPPLGLGLASRITQAPTQPKKAWALPPIPLGDGLGDNSKKGKGVAETSSAILKCPREGVSLLIPSHDASLKKQKRVPCSASATIILSGSRLLYD